MIYEGHEGESESDFEKHVEELRKLVDFMIAAATRYKDGDCDERTLAILVKGHGSEVRESEISDLQGG